MIERFAASLQDAYKVSERFPEISSGAMFMPSLREENCHAIALSGDRDGAAKGSAGVDWCGLVKRLRKGDCDEAFWNFSVADFGGVVGSGCAGTVDFAESGDGV